MRLIGNIFWFLFTGLESFLCWLLLGVLLCLTIVGIPFGHQCFKLAGLVVTPFGKQVHTAFSRHPIANILWLPLGLILCILYLFSGLFWCVTLLGIPFGLQCFKLAHLALSPFGAEVM